MTEQAIQRAIIKALEKEGAYVVKIITANRAGVADVVGSYQGRFFAIEVKAERGVVAPLQEYHGQKVLESGGLWGVARSVKEALKIVLDTRVPII